MQDTAVSCRAGVTPSKSLGSSRVRVVEVQGTKRKKMERPRASCVADCVVPNRETNILIAED